MGIKVFKPGMVVTARMDFQDNDEHDELRITHAGSVGWIHAQSHVDAQGLPAWTVHFPNGAALTFEDSDLRDPSQVHVAEMSDRDLLAHLLMVSADGLGALDAANTQIGQMRGLFDDSDGTIEEAVEAVDHARQRLSFARQLLQDRLGGLTPTGSVRIDWISGPSGASFRQLGSLDGGSAEGHGAGGASSAQGVTDRGPRDRFVAMMGDCDGDWWQAYTNSHPEACEAAAREINAGILDALQGGAGREKVLEVAQALLTRHSRLGFDDTEPRYMLDRLLSDLFEGDVERVDRPRASL